MLDENSNCTTNAACYSCFPELDPFEDNNTNAELNAANAYCNINGLHLKYSYSDSSINDKSNNSKPELMIALEDAIIGRFSQLLVWDIHYLGDSAAEIALVLEKLKKANIALFSLSENKPINYTISKSHLYDIKFELPEILEGERLSLILATAEEHREWYVKVLVPSEGKLWE